MQPRNILFINLPLCSPKYLEDKIKRREELTPHLVLPLGLLHLASSVHQHLPQWNTGILDYALYVENAHKYRNMNQFVRIEARKHAPFTPDVVAVSMNFTMTYLCGEQIIGHMRKIWPEATIIVGGTHATNRTRYVLENTAADLVFRGEAEVSLVQWLESLDTPGSPLPQGVYDRDKLGLSEPEELGEKAPIDSLPLPAWEMVDMPRYVESNTAYRSWLVDSSEKKAILFLSSRGCPNLCTYCSQHTVHSRKVRLRSIDSIVHEVKTLYERYGTTLFIPADDLFTASKRRTFKMLKALKALNIPGFEMHFSNGLNVNLLDEELIDALIDAGGTVFNFAIESGSPFTLKECMKKRVDLDKARRLVRYCRDKGVYTVCFSLMGFPKEQLRHIIESYVFFKTIEADRVEFSMVLPLVGTELERECQDKGLLPPDSAELWTEMYFHNRVYDMGPLSARDLAEFCRRASFECNYVENVNLREGRFDRAMDIFQKRLALRPESIFAHYCLYKSQLGLDREEDARATLKEMMRLLAFSPAARCEFSQYGDIIPEEDRVRLFGQTGALQQL